MMYGATMSLLVLLLLSSRTVDSRHWGSHGSLTLPSSTAVYSTRSFATLSSTVRLVGGGSDGTNGASADAVVPEAMAAEVDHSKEDDEEEEDAVKTAQDLSDDIARGGGAALKRKKLLLSKQKVAALAAVAPLDDTATPVATPETPEAAVVTLDTTAVEESPSRRRRGLSKFFHRKDSHKKRHKQIAKKLKNRNHTNVRRKVMHASFGIFFASLNHLIPKDKFVPGMAILSSATLLMELLRYRRGFHWMNQILHFVLGSSLRKHEMDGKFTGSFYFFTGVTLTAALFPKTCATMGICQLALADPSASYFGRATRHVYWSRIENGLGGFGRNKGILGFLGGALFCFPFNYRVLSIAKFGVEGMPGGRTSLMVASLALGFAGAFADLAVPTPALTLPKKICGVRVPPLHLDDNFVVPIVSGFACTQVFKSLAWPQHLDLARFMLLR